MKITMIVAAIAVLFGITNAGATADDEYSYCAKVKKTSDGFLALRQDPTSNSVMKVKLLTGWELVLDNKFAGNGGEWVKVTYVENLDNYAGINAKPTQGWVHRKYIKVYECGC